MQACWRTLMIPFSFLAFFSLVVGCTMHMIENDGTCVIGESCDQAFPFPNGSNVRLQAVTEDISAIPTSMQGVWLVLVTLTAVGYGIIYPVTSWGRVIMTLTMVLGVIYMTMPLTIVSASFMSIARAHKQADRAVQQLVIHQREEHKKRCRLFSHIVLSEHHEQIFADFKINALELATKLYDVRPLLGRARRHRAAVIHRSPLKQGTGGSIPRSGDCERSSGARGSREEKSSKPPRALRPPARPMSPRAARQGLTIQRSVSADAAWSTEKPLQSQVTFTLSLFGRQHTHIRAIFAYRHYQSTKWSAGSLESKDEEERGADEDEAGAEAEDFGSLQTEMIERFKDIQQKCRYV